MFCRSPYKAGLASIMLALGACTSMPPNEPSVLVLPGTGMDFEQFRSDNDLCKQYAFQQVSGRSPDSVAIDSGVRSAALGTLLGAAAGAAIDGGRGASVGAGTGLALGGLTGAGTADLSASRLQQRYDMGYTQCMYAKGHRVPVGSGLMGSYFGSYQERPHPAPPPHGPVIR